MHHSLVAKLIPSYKPLFSSSGEGGYVCPFMQSFNLMFSALGDVISLLSMLFILLDVTTVLQIQKQHRFKAPLKSFSFSYEF